MDYLARPKYHYKPASGWINDPNGLVYFNGYYHVFYQHAPDYELPWKQPMHWGHARTKDFLHWEELSVALKPDTMYDKDGCWSGTAIVKDGKLYLFYASIGDVTGGEAKNQTVSVACSADGINFEKCKENPVIRQYPADGGPDFRDPAVCEIGGTYYCVMASGNREERKARLLLYKSGDLLRWEYDGVMREWDECKYAECPSFMQTENEFLLAASVCPLCKRHYFSLMYGSFIDEKFVPHCTAEADNGPDSYAGQIFSDDKGRNILISWVPGWKYQGYAERDIGCLSVPREINRTGDRITAYPVEELRHLLKDSDPAVTRTDSGFIIKRSGREPVVYVGEIRSLEIIRDEYILEVYVNGGEQVYTVIL